MKKLVQLTAFATVLAIGILPAFGDTLILKSGERVSGYYEGGSARVVKFRSSAGDVKDYDILSVQQIQFGDAGSAANAAPATVPATSPASSLNSASNNTTNNTTSSDPRL